MILISKSDVMVCFLHLINCKLNVTLRANVLVCLSLPRLPVGSRRRLWGAAHGLQPHALWTPRGEHGQWNAFKEILLCLKKYAVIMPVWLTESYWFEFSANLFLLCALKHLSILKKYEGPTVVSLVILTFPLHVNKDCNRTADNAL